MIKESGYSLVIPYVADGSGNICIEKINYIWSLSNPQEFPFYVGEYSDKRKAKNAVRKQVQNFKATYGCIGAVIGMVDEYISDSIIEDYESEI